MAGGGGGAAAAELAGSIMKAMAESGHDDPLQQCQLSLRERLHVEPAAVLEIAEGEMEQWGGAELPMHWLRLYEDACLSQAAKMLREGADLTKIVAVLDTGIHNTGAPRRSKLFESVFQDLENLIEGDPGEIPGSFEIIPPQSINTNYPIARNIQAPSHEDFQSHLHNRRTPLIIPGITDRWTATQRWQDPGYFLRITLGGRRLVPVEIGEHWLAENYRTDVMRFRQFLNRYLLHPSPREIGYLAQHDLFTQVPGLREDITIPDYVYTSPPWPTPGSAAASTPGLDTVEQLEEPLLNVWIGPKGTKTPLHTDPYHNLLCQVIGYKYVRLFAPENRNSLYPATVDHNGTDISNTSLIDISPALPHATGGTGCPGGSGPKYGPNLEDLPGMDLDARRIELAKKFPLFLNAAYQEAILGPGESLYIPLGWWHFVESLSVSVSVSFWWN